MTSDDIDVAGPPIEPGPVIDEAPPSRWPTVIGTVSLIYAIGGTLCALGIMSSGFFTEAMMAMGGMKVQMPGVIKVLSAVQGLLLLIASIMLITGAIGTLKRKRSGPGLIKIWVLYRLVLLVIGAATTILTAPAQLQFQRSMLDAQQRRIDENGGSIKVNNVTDEQLWQRAMVGMGVMSAVFAVYPLFVGFYLSRRKVTAEIAEWP